MNQIVFHISGRPMRSRNAAIIAGERESPREQLVNDVIQSISTDIEVKVSDVTIHLAAFMDPDHWAEDWAEKLGEDVDVDEWIAEQVTNRE